MNRAPRAAAVAAILPLLAACAGLSARPGWTPPPPAVEAVVRAAEALLEEERTAEALSAAREAAALSPRCPEALRMLQSCRLAAGEDAAVRREAEAAAAADPGDPLALYLLARTERDGRRAERLLRRAAAADPGMPWPRLALAQGLLSRGDLGGADAALEEAEAAAPGHPLVPLLAAQAAAARKDSEGSLLHLREAVRRDPGGWRAEEALARRLARVPGGEEEARAALGRAFEVVPCSRGVASAWREALKGGAPPEDLRRAVEAVDRAAGPLPPAALHLRGAARLLLGDAEGALPDLQAAAEAGEDRTAALDDLRLAFFVLGRYPEALGWEEACTPPGLLRDPRSETDGRRFQLAREALDAAARPGDLEVLARLTDLCRRTGWLREAALLSLRRAALDPGDPGARADAAESIRTLRFLEDLRRAWKGAYHGYDAGGSGGGLEGALRALRDLSLRALGEDVTEGLARRSYAFLGEVADSVRGSGRSRAWFEAHGLALLVGRAAGEPAEARLLRVVSLRRDAEEESLGRRFRATVVVGEGLLVPSRREAGGAVLGGATVDDLVFVDLEGVARWSGASARRRRDPAERRLLGGIDREVPAAGEAEEASLRFPGRLTDRMALAVAAWDDPRAALGDFLDAALRHELAHAADAARCLPVLSHPVEGLRLLLRGRLSAAGTASVLEGDAEIAAVASAREPRAALATLVSFLPARDAGAPHGRGYHGAVEDLVAVLRERGAVPPGVVAVRLLDGIDPEVIRSAAIEVCRRRGLAATSDPR